MVGDQSDMDEWKNSGSMPDRSGLILTPPEEWET